MKPPRPIVRVAIFAIGVAIGLGIVGVQCGCGFAPGNAAMNDDATDASTSLTDGAITHATPDTAPSLSPDAPPTLVTLRETADDVYTNGHSDQCLVASTTQAQAYLRAFPLAALGIAGDFCVTVVSFVAVEAKNATGVTITIGTYTGTLTPSSTSLDPAALAWSTGVAINVPDSAAAQLVTVPVGTTTIAAGSTLVVTIGSPSYAGMAGTFVVGGSASAQTWPSFWEASACNTPTPSTRDGRNSDDVGAFIIDVIGYTP